MLFHIGTLFLYIAMCQLMQRSSPYYSAGINFHEYIAAVSSSVYAKIKKDVYMIIKCSSFGHLANIYSNLQSFMFRPHIIVLLFASFFWISPMTPEIFDAQIAGVMIFVFWHRVFCISDCERQK